MVSADRLLAFSAAALVVIVIPGPSLLFAVGRALTDGRRAGIALLSDSLWVMAAAAFRSWFARFPRRLELVGGAGGVAITAVGVSLLVSGRKD